jgi:hypothetical protein
MNRILNSRMKWGLFVLLDAVDVCRSVCLRLILFQFCTYSSYARVNNCFFLYYYIYTKKFNLILFYSINIYDIRNGCSLFILHKVRVRDYFNVIKLHKLSNSMLNQLNVCQTDVFYFKTIMGL